MSKTFSKHIFALFAALLVFLILGIPYTTMGFDSDCFGLVFFSSQIKNFHDLFLHLFKPIQSSYIALNELSTYSSEGFLTYFRPLMTLSHYLCFELFGLNSYAYHLINVGLHALTTGCIFYLFTNFFDFGFAFLLALAFAFHPALTPAYVGVTSHVVPGYLFWALMLLAYHQFLKTDRQKWYFLSVILFLLSLLCYEIIIVFPIVLILFLGMISNKNIIYRTYLFFIATFGYLAARFFLLGPAAAHEQKIFSISSLPYKIAFNWYQAVKPFWGLQQASNLVTIMVVMLFIGTFIAAWLQAPERRKRLTFYVSSFFLLAWPISLITADGRYFYPAIPFFVLILYEICSHITKKFSCVNEYFAIASLFIMLISWSVWHDTRALITRSLITHQRDRAFQGLVDYYNHIPDLRLIIIGTLHCYNGDTLLMQQGMTQAARLFFNNPELEAYHVTQAKIYCQNRTHQSFQITPLNNGFRFTSPQPDSLFFMIPHAWQEEAAIPFSMGTIIVHKKSASWKACDISFIFDNTWLHKADLVRTKFVTFDVKIWGFVELTLGDAG